MKCLLYKGKNVNIGAKYLLNLVHVISGGFKVGGALGKTKKGGPSDDVIILSQPW